jgi:chemotaxis signal transduction protein
MDSLPTSATAAEQAPQQRDLFQAVYCGALAVAFPYGWASSIVEKFQVTAVPRAPAWLFGASNIEGRIVPVIDLSRYGVRGMRAQRNERSIGDTGSHRLLIGGVQAENDEHRMAILFTGMPQQVGRNAHGSLNESHKSAAGTSITDGVAYSAQGERFAVVNVNRLYEQLSAELSAL